VCLEPLILLCFIIRKYLIGAEIVLHAPNESQNYRKMLYLKVSKSSRISTKICLILLYPKLINKQRTDYDPISLLVSQTCTLLLSLASQVTKCHDLNYLIYQEFFPSGYVVIIKYNGFIKLVHMMKNNIICSIYSLLCNKKLR